MAEILPYYGTYFDYGLGVVSAMDIDRLNIRMATRDAMDRAIRQLCERLGPSADGYRCLVDGRDGFGFPDLPVIPEYVVRGDSIYPEIMLASIIAKTSRDHIMTECDSQYPGYGFARHK